MARQQTPHQESRAKNQGSVSISHMVYGGFDTAGSRLHGRLISEGHYRCAHCRRADIGEMNAHAARPG